MIEKVEEEITRHEEAIEEEKQNHKEKMRVFIEKSDNDLIKDKISKAKSIKKEMSRTRNDFRNNLFELINFFLLKKTQEG